MINVVQMWTNSNGERYEALRKQPQQKIQLRGGHSLQNKKVPKLQDKFPNNGNTCRQNR